LNRNDGIKRSWIESDLSQLSSAKEIAEAINDESIDGIIYNAGIWEEDGFTEHYDFEKERPEDILNIIHVNTISAITSIQKLIPNLKKSEKGKIILIGSTDGLENIDSKRVSYAASKFGLRGVGSTLREILREDKIGVTCINPGSIAASIPYEDGSEQALAAYNGSLIPVQDIVSILKCIVNLSNASCVKEITIPAMLDTNA
jgi:short-subunit dehydrogenase